MPCEVLLCSCALEGVRSEGFLLQHVEVEEWAQLVVTVSFCGPRGFALGGGPLR